MASIPDPLNYRLISLGLGPNSLVWRSSGKTFSARERKTLATEFNAVSLPLGDTSLEISE
jgi:hypothetical protein